MPDWRHAIQQAFLLVITIVLTGCGGGGSDGNSSTSNGQKTGVLLDSIVVGIHYQTSSGVGGVTDEAGEFSYFQGDEVTFSLGSIELSPVAAKAVITPLDLFDTVNHRDRRLVNFIKLLQTLDDDGAISHSITLTPEILYAVTHAGLKASDLDTDLDSFASSSAVKKILESIPHQGELTETESALEHFAETLSLSNVLDPDGDGFPNATDSDDDNDGILDSEDSFPWDSQESKDSDKDGVGDNADLDDDNDGVPDSEENPAHVKIPLTELSPGTDYLYHKDSNSLYISNKADKTLTIIHGTTGQQRAQFSFQHMPSQLALGPDDEIFLSLLKHEHSDYRLDSDQSGQIAVINTNSLLVDRTLDIPTDPFDLGITPSGKIVTTSGSGQFPKMHTFESTTGLLIASADIRRHLSIETHPTEEWVISTRSNISNNVYRHNVSIADLNEVAESNYRYNSGVDGAAWITADGDYVITRGGLVLHTADLSVHYKFQFGYDVTIESLIADEQPGFSHATLSTGDIVLINTNSMLVAHTENTGRAIETTYSTAHTRVFISNSENKLTMIKTDHPCLDCSTNEAPTARLTSNKVHGTTADTIIFDASGSSDPEDSTSLQYRWDIDGDLLWDADFGQHSVNSHRYNAAGSYQVSVQVRDNVGNTHFTTQNITIESSVSPSTPVTDSNQHAFAYSVDESLAAPQIAKLFTIDQAAKRLYVMNLESGQTEAYFSLPYTPVSMSLTPDGSKLFVALATDNHENYGRSENEIGYVAEIDPLQMLHVSTIAVEIDPYDLIATSNGKLYISSASYHDQSIHSYDSSSGQLLDQAGDGARYTLSLSPDENIITASIETAFIREAFEIGGSEIAEAPGLIYPWDSGVDGNNLWFTPDGLHYITSYGDIVRVGDPSNMRSLDLGSPFASIEHIYFDADGYAHLAVNNFGGEAGRTFGVATLNLQSLEFIGTTPAPYKVQSAFVFNGQIHIISYETEELTIAPHPCPNCGDNSPPSAHFSVTPATGTTQDLYTFNASTSDDTEDGKTLLYRWDLDNNGEWDTEFSTSPITEKTFILQGNHPVTLQVMDSAGAVDSYSNSISVSQGINYGFPVTDSSPNILSFEISHVLNDPAANKTYISASDEGRLYVVNNSTGLMEHYFEMPGSPSQMAISPDGRTLYLGLRVDNNVEGIREEEKQNGLIAVLDLVTTEHTRTFAIDVDPYDIVVTNSNKLYVSAAVGQWKYIHAIDSSTGITTHKTFSRHQLRLSLHPSENWLFATDFQSLPYAINKYDFSDTSISLLDATQSLRAHDQDRNVWVSPDGAYVIAASGDVYLTSDMSFVTSLTANTVGVRDIAFDNELEVFYVIDSENAISRFDAESLVDSGRSDTHTNPQHLILNDGTVKVIDIGISSAQIVPVVF